MSFLYDKPFIVRIVEVLTALVGVVMLYLAYLNVADYVFAAVTAVLAVALLLCGTLLHLRKWYAWHYTMFLMIAAGICLVVSYVETADLLWVLLLGMDFLLAVSWIFRVTRQYFDAAV
ncbi:MAG: hypothetical protein PHT00_02335 [Candidatus Methanomethylophilus sp.]|nr:hypothetical protein [Methanomethylophilus sp.]MDD3232993.1 hypothetical protein [Methanomethylophilus sp.]MDD4222098.1 hypothetical protein [Methanomethylophilus sp.]MDD4668929.1 hypothetical protein [Methanomethylophilus sp.]